MASFLTSMRKSGSSGPKGADDPAPLPPPAVETWGAPLLEACSAVAGCDLHYVEAPTALDHAQGPWAFGTRLGGGDPGDDWSVPLTVRLATDRRELEREAAATGLNRGHGLGAPAVRAVVALEVDDGATPLCALISETTSDVALPDLIGFNLHQADDLLTGFAAHHEAIHRLPVADLDRDHSIPTVVATDELARIDAARFGAQLDWLAQRVPTATDAVLCHGGYQPLCVHGPPPDEWAAHGGPGKGLTVGNWCGAVLAEAEFDVAFTLVAFWSAHCFAKNRSERTAIKMIRNTLLNTYKVGYQAHRELDPDRLRFWQAFHALRGLARLGGAYDPVGSPFAPQDRGPLPDQLEAELERHFTQLTRVR